MKKKTKKRVFRLLTGLICLAAVAVLAVFGISEYVRWTTKDDIILSFTSDAMKEEIDEEMKKNIFIEPQNKETALYN